MEIKHKSGKKTEILNQIFDKASVTWKRTTKKTTLTLENLQFLPLWEVFNWNVIAQECIQHFSTWKHPPLYSYLTEAYFVQTLSLIQYKRTTDASHTASFIITVTTNTFS